MSDENIDSSRMETSDVNSSDVNSSTNPGFTIRDGEEVPDDILPTPPHVPIPSPVISPKRSTAKKSLDSQFKKSTLNDKPLLNELVSTMDGGEPHPSISKEVSLHLN